MQIGWNDSKNVSFLDKLLHAIYTYTIVFTLRFLSFFIEDHFYNLHTYSTYFVTNNEMVTVILYCIVYMVQEMLWQKICVFGPRSCSVGYKMEKINNFLLFITSDRKLQLLEYGFDFKCYVPALILKI